jgi:membrane-associated protein
MLVLGYVLGESEWVKRNLEIIIIGIIVVTTGPVLFKMLTRKKSATIEIGKEVVKETIESSTKNK